MTKTLYSIPIRTAGGGSTTLEEYRDQLLLVVNTASRCGLTPQYADLQELLTRYGELGLAIVAFPCNQFNGQEPGTDGEIQAFCSMTYGIDFPVFGKVDVNGDDRHPIYTNLAAVADSEGVAGDVQWNFEKFLVAPGGRVVGRIRPKIRPTEPAVVALVEQYLPIAQEVAR